MCVYRRLWFDSYYSFIRFIPDVSFIHSWAYIGLIVIWNSLRSLCSSASLATQMIRDLMGERLPLTIVFAMHPFPPCLSFMRCVYGVFIHSNLSTHSCTMISFGKTGSHPLAAINLHSAQPHVQAQLMSTITGNTASSTAGRTLALNEDVISTILAATHAMPPWKARQMEGASWTGTVEENTSPILAYRTVRFDFYFIDSTSCILVKIVYSNVHGRHWELS